jgi:hypothetical protein
VSLSNILWLVLVVLVVLWLLSFVIGLAADLPLVHILIVVAVIILIYNLMTSRRGAV